MNHEIQSYSTRQQRARETRHFFLPDLTEFLLYLTLSFLLLIIIEAGNLWDYFNQNVVGQTGGFSSVFNQNVPFLHKVTSLTTGGPLLQFLFWALFGIFIYIFYWFAKNLVIDFYNDFVIGKYYIAQIHVDEKRYWLSVVMRNLVFVLSLVLMIVFIFEGGRLIYDMASLFFTSLTSFHGLVSLLDIFASIVMTAVLMHVFIVLIRVTVISWRYLSQT